MEVIVGQHAVLACKDLLQACLGQYGFMVRTIAKGGHLRRTGNAIAKRKAYRKRPMWLAASCWSARTYTDHSQAVLKKYDHVHIDW